MNRSQLNVETALADCLRIFAERGEQLRKENATDLADVSEALTRPAAGDGQHVADHQPHFTRERGG